MMPHKLNVRRNQLDYSAFLSSPMLDWLGNRTLPARALVEAFSPLGFGVESLQIVGATQNASQQAVQMLFGGQGNYTCKVDRSEASFWNLETQAMERAAELLGAADASLRKSPSWHVKSHQFGYSAHSELTTGSLAEVLGQFKILVPKSGGQHIGTGLMFHWKVPKADWETLLTLDRSIAIPNGLFVHFILTVGKDKINFPQLLGSARSYLQSVLADIGLILPD